MNRKERRRYNALQAEMGDLVGLADLSAITAEEQARFHEIRAEMQRLRAGSAPPADPPPPNPRAVRRAAPDPREAERSAWRKVVAMRYGGTGAGRKIWHPERTVSRAEADISDQVRQEFDPWGYPSWNRRIDGG